MWLLVYFRRDWGEERVCQLGEEVDFICFQLSLTRTFWRWHIVQTAVLHTTTTTSSFSPNPKKLAFSLDSFDSLSQSFIHTFSQPENGSAAIKAPLLLPKWTVLTERGSSTCCTSFSSLTLSLKLRSNLKTAGNRAAVAQEHSPLTEPANCGCGVTQHT